MNEHILCSQQISKEILNTFLVEILPCMAEWFFDQANSAQASVIEGTEDKSLTRLIAFFKM